MSVSRVIEVSFGNETVVYVNIDTAYYYNDGVIIKPTDGDLPDTYQVHWADSPEAQTTLETIGTSEGVPVPDELWGRSKVIYGWFYLHPTEDSSVTYKEIRIYKSARAGLPDGTEPTPSEHSTIDQLISAMNTAADKAEQNADSASSDADRAETARSEAESYATNAQTSASNAEASATTATNQAQIATTSATTATTAAQTATTKATEASNSASSAAESASSASNSADSASRSEQAAKISETNAADSESNASTYANSARGYAQTAQSASASASSSATSASNSATSASNSATSASQSATASANSATASAESASASAQIKSDVEDLVDDAQASANASAQSASQASASEQGCARAVLDAASAAAIARARADEASGYAQTASTKASEAVESVETATQKATEASQSASQALSYKTDAESAKTASQTAQGLAESARDTAVSAKTDAESARDDAESARDEAQQAVASISGALIEKAPVITDTASGAIASFSDGADDLPLKNLVVDINPIQDLHGQEAPWPAGGGKNLFQTTAQSKTEQGVTWTVNADGTITVSGTATGYTAFETGLARVDSSMGNITVSGIASATNIVWGSVQVRDVNLNVLYTISNGGMQSELHCDLSQYPDAYYVRVLLKRNNNIATSGTVKIQVEKGSSATSFAPYENLCPISGWTQVGVEQRGVNVWDEEWERGTIDTTGAKKASVERIRSKNYIPVAPNTTYYINISSYAISAYGCIRHAYDINKNPIGVIGSNYSTTFTTPDNCYFVMISPHAQYGTTYNHDISINYPSTDHSYHPYTGRSITIQLGQTVYGGKLDVLSGELVIDRAMVDLGTLNWQYVSDDVFFTSELYGIKKPGIHNYINSTYGFSAASFANMPDKTMKGNTIAGGMYVKDSAFEQNPATAKTGLSGVQLVYELATPITIQLTSNQVNSLLGVNNLWADSGDTEVEYRADTKLFIERLTAPDSADMIADANITSGQYFMVGNSLYKATANIANGAQIIVGTNAVRKSLSEALNEINA